MNKAKVTANPGESLIHIERIFDTTPEKFFKAVTTKELIQKWWTGPGYDVTVEEYEPREGGKWRFIHRKEGEEFTFFGVLHEVSPTRIIQTFEFSGLPERGHVILERMDIASTDDGKVRMNVTQSYLSVQDRDGMLQSGMEDGMNETYSVLDEVLKTL
jgi:uncharacterized protein YndB with AHSA1/START domain